VLEAATGKKTSFTKVFVSRRDGKGDPKLETPPGDVGSLALADVLPKLPHLTALDLSANPIDDVGAVALSNAMKSLTHLRELSLDRLKGLKDGSIAALLSSLHTFSHLRVLTCRCELPSASWTACEEWASLSCVGPDSSLGQTGAKHLSSALLACPELHSLYLPGNMLAYVSMTALVDTLTRCGNLKSLYLRGVCVVGGAVTNPAVNGHCR
jgi:hypothetical protein